MSFSANALKFYIDGQWVDPVGSATLDVINPATEAPFMTIALGGKGDVDRAVAAAREAFETWAFSTREERLALLRRVLDEYNRRFEDIARAVTAEMGAPIDFARDAQAWAGRAHMEAAIKALEDFTFEETRGTSRVIMEPIGVAALITPWNWPLNQIVCKVAPALAAGCTVVLKPSEIAPASGLIFAEIMAAAGTPPGVFNLVNGNGPDVGQVLAEHPGVDMVSFTGSTRAGILVAKAAANTVKRVAQELGGKSANIILPDADLASAVESGVRGCFSNSGQSCDAPTRMLVPADRHAEALEIARATAATMVVGDPLAPATTHGPVISDVQWTKIQRLIQTGIDEGAVLVTGGTGLPEGIDKGYFVRPTVFGGVTPDMTVAREEIFGMVLSIMPYGSVEQAITIANDTVYGLANYIAGKDIEQIRSIARRLRSGTVQINYPEWDVFAPFGGYKQSGNGREYADYGIHDFLEIKGVIGWG
ncbi:aldehyde dehydrogenase family protein [Novosphingobium sp. Fuku2-ISO-50]|uniref:aldehyde dehydrogenase family protein n=1 Tax=Novosphingobium sp. Fuku2-ISO-50 TaxID=1739114 RepID=UPI00076CB93C|nr:aldehyde dehydrogenase family protein [Novosphingobium sp. Fuku2-ISO-50]KUR76518.1 aldehyde dehydrogenase [Novosphingobium sp. Fuku2-ISO-50]